MRFMGTSSTLQKKLHAKIGTSSMRPLSKRGRHALFGVWATLSLSMIARDRLGTIDGWKARDLRRWNLVRGGTSATIDGGDSP